MKSKRLLIGLVVMVLVSGGAFAQSNTITVDLGPTIIGAGFGIAGNALMGSEMEAGAKVTGFGIGAQYERQLMEKVTVGGKFTYMGVGMSMSMDTEEGSASASASVGVNLSSISLEAHARYYPGGRTFFFDGMLGYASMSLGFSGNINVSESSSGLNEDLLDIQETFTRSFLKLGIKTGWRIDFGNPGGFVFEPAFGWSVGIGGGATFFDKLNDYAKDKMGPDASLGDDMKDTLDLGFGMIEKFIFVGGPRFTLSFGWRF